MSLRKGYEFEFCLRDELYRAFDDGYDVLGAMQKVLEDWDEIVNERSARSYHWSWRKEFDRRGPLSLGTPSVSAAMVYFIRKPTETELAAAEKFGRVVCLFDEAPPSDAHFIREWLQSELSRFTEREDYLFLDDSFEARIAFDVLRTKNIRLFRLMRWDGQRQEFSIRPITPVRRYGRRRS